MLSKISRNLYKVKVNTKVGFFPSLTSDYDVVAIVDVVQNHVF